MSIAPPPLESWPSGLGVEVEWFRGCILVAVGSGTEGQGVARQFALSVGWSRGAQESEVQIACLSSYGCAKERRGRYEERQTAPETSFPASAPRHPPYKSITPARVRTRRSALTQGVQKETCRPPYIPSLEFRGTRGGTRYVEKLTGPGQLIMQGRVRSRRRVTKTSVGRRACGQESSVSCAPQGHAGRDDRRPLLSLSPTLSTIISTCYSRVSSLRTCPPPWPTANAR